LVRCADLYLKKGGCVSFVMPRGIFSADQHHNFRSGNYALALGFTRLVDLEGVTPLFNMPSCVVQCVAGTKTSFPLDGTVITGTLPRKNATLSQALSQFSKIEKTKFALGVIGERTFISRVGETPAISVGLGRSPYFERFLNGAAAYPRQFWFVEITSHPKLGLDPKTPFLRTSSRAVDRAKEAYKKVELSGNVEVEFLYALLTGSELVPFGHLEPIVAVLPVEPDRRRGGYRVIQPAEAKSRGLIGLERWLRRVESIWSEKRGEKAKAASVYEWLDYQGKLTTQDPSKKFKVLYNTSGTYLVSCVAKNEHKTLKVNGASIRLNGLIADCTTFWYETDDEDEAHYMSAVLNAPRLDAAIKPMQAKGAFGERHIHKKPLEFPIPLYDPDNPTHGKLVELSKECHRKVGAVLPVLAQKYGSVGKIRSEIKKELRDEIEQIDRLAKQVLR